MKKMIFHIPTKINTNLHSGSQIRPQKMIQAFKDIGYDVELIMGNCSTRRIQIKQIKENIKLGIKYDFLYSESTTSPTLFTEKNHFLKCLFLDFNFFKYCKANSINIGFFYRDIHWVFKEYINYSSAIKKTIFKFFYMYDLREYVKYIDILYLPSVKMDDYVPIDFNNIVELPPGIEKNHIKELIYNKKLSFIYVGGLGLLYDLTLFSNAISTINGVEFNICVREKEWLENKHYYNYLNNTKIYHKTHNELKDIYKISSIGILFVAPTIYWKFAMAVKLFEYISYRKPIIAVKNTAVGDFVEKNDIGWVIDYDKNKLKELIDYLQNNLEEIDKKIKNIEKIIPENTWESRAMKVTSDLK